MHAQKEPMRLALCTIVTARVDEMRAFYESLLDRSPEVKRGNYFFFPLAGAGLALWRASEFEAYHSSKQIQNGPGAVLIEIEVEDAVAEFDRVCRLGFTPVDRPQTLPWGHTQFTVRDPEGNLVVFFSQSE